jgi:hypothetical protein
LVPSLGANGCGIVQLSFVHRAVVDFGFAALSMVSIDLTSVPEVA